MTTQSQRPLSCPALILASSGDTQGCTEVVAALARYHRQQGRRVRVFKTGADFYSPCIQQCASGAPVELLDLWLVGENRCRELLHEAAAAADLIIIESSASLYDTHPGCVELSRVFGIPLYVIVDATADFQLPASPDADDSGWGASNADELIEEVVTLTAELPVAGVIVNRAERDFNALRLSSRLVNGVRYLGSIAQQSSFSLPLHHHDLLTEAGYARLDRQLDKAAAILARSVDIELPAPVTFAPVTAMSVPRLLEGVRIGIAHDQAFAYIYHANVRLLQEMGAELQYFSPLTDPYVPAVDSLWFPGGFPELHLDELAKNLTMKASVREFHQQGKPILAECGGMMYMLGSLVDRAGIESGMVGLLPGKSSMTDRLADVGMQSVVLDEQTIRGHVFHYSRLESGMQPVTVSSRRYGRRPGETLYQYGSLVACYVHFYFPSNPLLTARFLGSPMF